MATKSKRNVSKAIVKSDNDREAPIERSMKIADIVSSVMAQAQLEMLTAKTPAHAIKTREGGKGQLLKYVPHGYVTDKLNQAFGFDWDYKLLPYFDGGSIYHMEIAQAGINPKTKEPILRRYISIYGELTVRIHNPKKLSEVIATVTKPGPGSSVWYPENEWGDALKSAKSDGLKVAAHELGIALDLYWDDEAEFNKHQELEHQREQEAIEAMVIEVPQNGIELITKAKDELGMDKKSVLEKLGMTFSELNNNYSVELWDKVKG